MEVAERHGRFLPPRAALLVVLALESVYIAVLVDRGYFFADDFINFDNAKTTGFSWATLSADIFGHFVPLFNLLSLVIVETFPYKYGLIVGLDVVMFCATLLAFHRLIRAVVPARPWLAVGLTGLAGMTLVTVPGVLWWANSASNLPALCFSLLSIDGAWRYLAEPKRIHLVQAVTCFTLGLGFFESALIVIPADIVIWLLFANTSVAAGPTARRAARRWQLWAGLAVPALADVAYRFAHRDLYKLPNPPNAVDMVHFLQTAWFDGFAPAMIGIEYPYSTVLNSAILTQLLGQVALLGVIAVTLAMSRKAWRGWAFFAVVGLVYVVATGYARVNLKGSSTGLVYDYLFFCPYLFLLGLALALRDTPWGAAESSPQPVDESVHPRRRPILWAGAGALGLGLVGVLASTVVSAAAIADNTNEFPSLTLFENPASPRTARLYFDALRSTLTAVRPKLSSTALYDTLVSSAVMGNWYLQFRPDSEIVADVFPWLTFGRYAPSGELIDPAGTLQPATFDASAPGVLAKATAVGGATRSADPGVGICVDGSSAAGAGISIPVLNTGPVSQASNPLLHLGYDASRTFVADPTMVAKTGSANGLRQVPDMIFERGDHSVLVQAIDVAVGLVYQSLFIAVPDGTHLCITAAGEGTPNVVTAPAPVPAPASAVRHPRHHRRHRPRVATTTTS